MTTTYPATTYAYLNVNYDKFIDLDKSTSLKRFGVLPNTGVDVSVALQNAINTLYDAGGRCLYVPPGTYLINRSNSIQVQEGMAIVGEYNQSIFKGFGTMPVKSAFPKAGTGMFVLAQRNGNRYGTELSRLPSGTGATFNVTVTGGAVTAATVTAGGTGFKVKDEIYLPNNTVLVVATVTSHRGPVATVTIKTPGSGWGVPSNPVAQTSSRGMLSYDRVMDPNSFASSVCFQNIVIDGDWGYDQSFLTGPAGTGGQFYPGISVTGCKNVIVKNVIAYRFPNTAILTFDCKRGYITDNIARDCGWRGVFGTSRNCFSSSGNYYTDPSCSALNTDEWIFRNNLAYDAGDVGLQFANIGGGIITNNQVIGAGTIGIEGEASGFDVDDTFALNGGVVIPSDCLITDNIIDCKMVDGHLATTTTTNPGSYTSTIGLDGVSWNCGNQGRIQFSNNIIRNTQRYGLKITQLNDGIYTINDNIIDKVNTSTDGNIRQQAIYLTSRDIAINRNKITNVGSGSAIFISPALDYLVIEDNEIDINSSIGGSSAAEIYVKLQRPNASGKRVSISRNKLSNFQTNGVLFESSGGSANAVKFSSMKFDGNMFYNGGRNSGNGASAYIELTTLSGAKIDYDIITVDNNIVYEATSSGHNLTTDPVVKLVHTNLAAPTLVSISGNKAPQFTTKYTVTVTNAPITTSYINNV